jgi:hypothetical protein
MQLLLVTKMLGEAQHTCIQRDHHSIFSMCALSHFMQQRSFRNLRRVT